MIIQLNKIFAFLVISIAILLAACSADTKKATLTNTALPVLNSFPKDSTALSLKEIVIPQEYHRIAKSVTAGGYFDFMEDLLAHLDTTVAYALDEYVVVRANPWLIDSLAATDYYVTSARGQFVEDPKTIQILAEGDSLLIPSLDQVRELQDRMAMTVIDVNIPEFKLRIKEGVQTLYEFDVRVGKNTQRYLAMAGRKVDLRTQPGIGEIVRIARDPAYINPRNNKRYAATTRDDGKRTKLPRIPWIEPVIDGQRFGQLIHPTTNIGTLGKAYSNGCVGTSEADAWRIYFHAPLGTKVQYRYDLEVENSAGDSLQLKDIYPGFKKTKKKMPVYA